MICTLGMAVLILDSKTALTSARDGIQLCLQTVIPSLFPLVVLSGILNGAILGAETKALSPIAKLLRIPQRAVSILMVSSAPIIPFTLSRNNLPALWLKCFEPHERRHYHAFDSLCC